MLLSIAANLDWPLFQLDVKNAFLNGDLEEVYMGIPPGFMPEAMKNKVCKLRKSLYGLKQSPQVWFCQFTNVLTNDVYLQCQSDHTLFVKNYDGKVTIIIVYVDDIVLTGNHER